MTLPEQLLAIHRALDQGDVPHAFGGAIALAYWTQEPRGTRDLDVNAFLPEADAETVLRALPDEIRWSAADLAAIQANGQRRLWWEETPVDLFLDYAPVHASAAAHRRLVPFAGAEIPVLGPVELAVFKVMFDRTRDWADIEAMVAAQTVDLAAVRGELSQMLELDDERWQRLDDAVRRAS